MAGLHEQGVALMLSEYFEELYKAYSAELEDLETDSEGKNVLSQRLDEKRGQLSALLPMMEVAPEMVAPIFHGACSFPNAHAMVKLSFAEPEDFPDWEALAPVVAFESWAQKYVDLILKESSGERFLISAVCLEFLHEKKTDRSVQAGTHSETSGGDDDHGDGDDLQDEDRDLDDAGADWLADQGFDRRG